ncbi:MAG: DNA topoisomerase IV subunit B, partial [Clostridia bacterium]|nr:DNA topoisomerase IV subunit B [Clostridia bacterium]
MYIGSTGQRGLHHLIYEIVDNSIDEALAGRCDTITVKLHKDGSVSVQDNGSGVPSGTHPKMGIPTLEVVFTVLHAGGKFGGGGYKISGGLHGVGASVVNALSEWMEVVNCYDGKEYTERFERGKVARAIECTGETEKHGLYVRFMPDSEIFTEMDFDYTTVLNRLREQAFLTAGVTIDFYDERDFDGRSEMEAALENGLITEEEALQEDEEEREDGGYYRKEREKKYTRLYFEGGIRSFVSYLNEKKRCNLLNENVIYISSEGKGCTAEVALQYNDSFSDLIVTFANNMCTIDGGTHETGFKMALTKVINEYARKANILKEKDKNLSGDDVREGLCAVVSVKLPDAQFESQTKAKLGNSEVRTIVDNIVNEKLTEFFEDNPSVAKAIIEKALAASRAREAARKARDLTRRKGALEGFSLPDKLADCNDKRSE